MKTHKARWYWKRSGQWELRARKQDGGAVLATIEEREYCGGLVKYVASIDPACLHYSRYAAQRAVRRALKEDGDDRRHSRA